MATNHVPADDLRPQTPVTIMTNSALFSPGQIVVTPGALALIEQRRFDLLQLLKRHMHGDWGNCHPDDAALNSQALRSGSRLMSVYRLVAPEVLAATPREKQQDLPTIWLITDATLSEKDDPLERNVTTFLCPSEY